MPASKITSKQFRHILTSLCMAGVAGVCGCKSSCENRCDYYQIAPYAEAQQSINAQPIPQHEELSADAPASANRPLSSPRETAARFEGLGGVVEMDPQGQIGVLDLSTAKVTAEDLQEGHGLDHLTQLDLSNTPISDAALEQPAWLQSLERLSLNKTQITDEGLRSLQGLSNLRLLWLNDTVVSDEGLAHLSGLTGLQSLGLNNTSVTDAGMVHLSRMRGLKYLLLGRTDITDAGLEHLKGLVALEGLSLVGTNVTAEGVARLQELLPDCQIVADKEPVVEEPAVDEELEVAPTPKLLDEDTPDFLEEESSRDLLDEETSIEPRKRDRFVGGMMLSEASKVRRASSQGMGSSTDSVEITRYYIGIALAEVGDTQKALSLLVETVGSASAHYNLGVILSENGEREASEEQFRIALQYNPELVAAHVWLNALEPMLADGLEITPVHVESEQRTDLSNVPTGVWSGFWDELSQDE